MRIVGLMPRHFSQDSRLYIRKVAFSCLHADIRTLHAGRYREIFGHRHKHLLQNFIFTYIEYRYLYSRRSKAP